MSQSNKGKRKTERAPEPRAKNLDRIFHEKLAFFRDEVWKLWTIPKAEQKEALRYELGREVFSGVHKNRHWVLPGLLNAWLLNLRGRAWLELTSDERRGVADASTRDGEVERVLEAMRDNRVPVPAALVVPERPNAKELQRLRDRSKPPLVESLWATGNPAVISGSARIFHVAVCFDQGLPAVVRAFQAALEDYAARLEIAAEPPKGKKTHEAKSGLMKLGMARLRRESRKMSVAETVTLWNEHADEAWRLGDEGSGDKQMQNVGTDLRALISRFFPEAKSPQ